MSDHTRAKNKESTEQASALNGTALRETVIGRLANTCRQLCREVNDQASIDDANHHCSIALWTELKLDGSTSAEALSVAEKAMSATEVKAKSANEWCKVVLSEIDNYAGYLDALTDEQIASSQANSVAQGNPTCDHYRDFCLSTMSAKQQSEAIRMGPVTDFFSVLSGALRSCGQRLQTGTMTLAQASQSLHGLAGSFDRMTADIVRRAAGGPVGDRQATTTAGGASANGQIVSAQSTALVNK
jgi:hypothetical protein